jgi:hypothetical protein
VFTLNGGTLFAVGKFLSNISLQVSSTSPVYSQPVTLTATVTGNGPTPTQTVSFYDGSTLLGSATLNGSGQAAITVSTLVHGGHSITAVYSGDANYIPRTSAATTVNVTPDTTTTTLMSSPNPSMGGQLVTFTATVSSNAPGTGIPAGTVTFRTTKTILATRTLDSSGHASFSTSTLPGGSTTVTAIYNNSDGNFLTSSGSTVQVVNKTNSSTSLTSSLNPSHSGDSVTFTATVTAGGNPVTSGSVTFKDGKVILAVVSLNSSGVAAFTISTLSVGTHKILAVYGGNNNYNGSTSNQVTQVVNSSGAVKQPAGTLSGSESKSALLTDKIDQLMLEPGSGGSSSITTGSDSSVKAKHLTTHDMLDIWRLDQLFAAM